MWFRPFLLGVNTLTLGFWPVEVLIDAIDGEGSANQAKE